MTAVAHDAGGAEVVSSYVRQHPGEWIFSLGGPALAIFERKLGAVMSTPLEVAVQRGEWLLTGTGWQSDLEWRALELARCSGKKSVAFLDHWTNYAARFDRRSVIHLPDEIWVGDRHAQSVAEALFRTVPIRLVPNPYLIDVVVEIEAASRSVLRKRDRDAQRVLYVCEPIRASAEQLGMQCGYDEFEALRFFFRNVNRVTSRVDAIVVRPHPADPPGKYQSVLDEFPMLPVILSTSGPLAGDIAAADLVVGCETMALVVALAAGKRVISCVPDGGKPCSLPHDTIEHLTRFVGAGEGASLETPPRPV